MMKCERPDWSEESFDHCPCDSTIQYMEAIEEGFNPCEECSYYKEKEEINK